MFCAVVSTLVASRRVDPVAMRAKAIGCTPMLTRIRGASTGQMRVSPHRCTQGNDQGPAKGTQGETNNDTLHGKGLSK